MSRKRPDQLEPWTVWLRDALAARGRPARLAYDDKIAGDVLVLAIDAGERDRLVEVTITRRPKGRAHLAALATTLEGATAAHEAMARMHNEISRLANAKRKFIHRIERLLEQLVRGWAERAAERDPAREGALEALRAGFPEAVPMTGVGFHVDVAGTDEHHTRDAYPSIHGAAVLIDGRWRGLPWDPAAARWMMHPGTMTAARRDRPTANIDGLGIALVGAAAMGTAIAATLTSGTIPDISTDVQTKSKDRTCHWSDAFDPCDLDLDMINCSLCSPSLADLGNFVPDCDVIDCGALDCSF